MPTNTSGGTTTSLNNTPQAVDDFYTANEDQVLFFNVMANDLGGSAKTLWSIDNTSDDGSADLVAKDVAGVCEYSELGAKISLTSDGRICYDTTLLDSLAAGQTVTDQFTYAIRMSNGTLSWATVNVTLTGTNDGPVAVSDVGSGNEDALITGNVAANDSDVDNGAVLTYAVNGTPPAGFILNPTTGAWSLDAANDAYQYLDDGETADVVVSYTVTDEHGESATAALTITVNGVNDAPVSGGPASANGTEDDASIGGSVPPATDVDGEALTYHLVSGSVLVDGNPALDGTVTLNPNGSYSYTPTLADQGLDTGESHVITFNYVANDGTVNSAPAGVTITVNGVNDAPVSGGPASANGTEDDASIGGSVPAASDVDGEALTYHLVSGSVLVDGVAAADGTVSLNANGSYSYTPTLADQGLDTGESHVITFNYVANDGTVNSAPAGVTITVAGVNDAPVSGGPASANGTEDDASIGGSVPPATDVDGEALTYHLVSGSVLVDGNPALDGTVTLNPNGSYSYTPTLADQGLDTGESHVITFNYVANDGTVNSAPAGVTITVNGVNDAPVSGGPASANGTEDDASIGGSVPAASDVDGEALTYHLVSGSVLVDGVAAADGTVSLNANGSYSYTPTLADQGLDTGESHVITFNYVANDGTVNSAPAGVTITVAGVNDAPVSGGPASANGTEDDASIGGSVPPATDVDGEALTYHLVSGSVLVDGVAAADGTVTLNPNGSYSYTPTLADQGLDTGESHVITFNYVANDGTVNSAPAGVTITVAGVNDAPVLTGAAAVLAAGSEDNSYTVTQAQLVQGWTDVDIENLTATGLSASNGSVVLNPDGSYTITPTANYNGPVTLFYFVSDGTDPVATSLGYVLAPVNDPAAISGAVSGAVTEDAVPNTVGGNLNSTDVDGVNDSWTVVASATASANGYGTYTIDAAGNWVYALNNANPTVNALNTGSPALSDSFTVMTADGTSQVVNITINGHTDFTYTPPPLSNAPDPNDFDALRSANTAASLVIMAPGSGPNGSDTLDGSNGTDTIYAGTGNDQVYGHNGGDHIYGENGADISLYGQAGDDFIYGGNGDDTIYGGSGNDTIYGNSDPNAGGASADTIYGGSGQDTIYGQDGNDIINGGNGQDLITGGAGADIYVYQKATDTGDFIFDFQQGSDKIDLAAFGFDAGDFIGSLSGAGQVAAGQFGYMTYNNGTTTVTTIYVDTDGVYGADMEITLVAPVALTSGDFLFGP